MGCYFLSHWKKAVRLLVFLSIPGYFFTSFAHGRDQDYYVQVLEYGTDSDIVSTFSEVKENLGEVVNKRVLDILHASQSEKVKRVLFRYAGVAELGETESILLKELKQKGENDDYNEEVVFTIGKLKKRTSLGTLEKVFDEEGTSQRVKGAIVDAFGEIGDIIIQDKLILILSDEYQETDVRARAILALGKINSKKALPLLSEILLNRYESKILRMYSASSIGKIGKEASLDTLQEVIFDETHEVAEYAVNAIAEIRSEKGGNLLIEALRSDYDKVRYYAIKGLSQIKYRKAIDILKFKAQYDSNETVRNEAKKALEIIQGSNKKAQEEE